MASLVTAVQSQPITLNDLKGKSFNYIQFRTAAGGVEIGSVQFDATGADSHLGLWPYGSQNGTSPFTVSPIPTNGLTAGPGNAYLALTQHNQTDTIFGTAAGFFAVDTANGAIVSMGQTATRSFDAAHAGTYHALAYARGNATTGQGNVETGTAAIGMQAIDITSGGGITVTDDNTQAVLASGTLAPVADQAYLVGPNELTDPCNGLFTVRTTTPNSQQDVFVTFLNGALLIGSFQTALPLNGGDPYGYFYGVGLR